MNKAIAMSGVTHKDFPSTSLVVTGARPDQIRETVLEKNPVEQAGIAASQMLIENTDLSISEIGYRVGYSYPASFTQAIRNSV
ncbi:MAG: hypothetical protein RID07_10540 [Lacipirellulaceae bacterium]|uniref:hypothetical protein n=1 Tax=Marinobacter salarius TaxID=1420917 RepID=UPI0032EB0593